MKFHYDYKTKVSDLWQLSMYYAYSSYLAVINVVCFISSVILMIKFFPTGNLFERSLLLLFFLLFTFLQPSGIWFRAKQQLEGNEKELSITIDDNGMLIVCDNESQTKKWGEIRLALVKPTLIAIYTDKAEGYIIANRILKGTRKELISFLKEKLGEKVK